MGGARAGVGRQPEPGLGAHDSTPHQEHLVRFVTSGHTDRSIAEVELIGSRVRRVVSRVKLDTPVHDEATGI